MTDYLPRNIYEISDLFEDLVFMRAAKFVDDNEASKSEKMSLNPKGLQLLGNLGITSRIFRRWYQTTWGFESPSAWFEGETPRMELSKLYPDLTEGQAYISAQLLKGESDGVKVMPVLYEKKEIKKAGGLIAMGHGFLPKTPEARDHFHHLPPPNFDPEFKEFMSIIEDIEQDIVKGKVEELPKDFEARYWEIFWSDACITIPLNCGLSLSRDKLIFLGSSMRLILGQAIKEQKSIPNSYINFDRLFFEIWKVFQDLDQNLMSLESFLVKEEKSISAIIKEKNGLYSLNVYYQLGNLIDELLLFPADRYFGALECVWTDKMNFINDLVMGISLLNNNLKLPPPDKKLTVSQKKFQRFTDIEKGLDIYRIWFCPPTCFRVLPKFFNYF